MLTNLRKEPAVSEGGLMELGGIQKELLEKRKLENYYDKESRIFTTLFLECNDILLGPEPSWNDMDNDQGCDVTTKIIETCSQSGDLYVNTYKNETKEDLIYSGTMMYTEIKMDIDTSSDYCFPVDCSSLDTEYRLHGGLSRAMIRIPAAVFQLVSPDASDSKSSVGTVFDMENGMMPNYIDDEVSVLEDGSFLLQTTLDFKLVDTKITNLSSQNEVEITFKLEGNQVGYLLKSNYR